MKRFTLIAMLALALAKPSLAQTQPAFAPAVEDNRPQTLDCVLLGGGLTLIWMDVLTSIDMRRHRDPRYVGVNGQTRIETDPLIVWLTGTQTPSDRQFITLGLASSALLVGSWALVPEKYRWIPPALAVTVEGYFVAHNFTLGLTIKL